MTNYIPDYCHDLCLLLLHVIDLLRSCYSRVTKSSWKLFIAIG